MNKPLRITPATMVVLGMGYFASHFFWAFSSGSFPLFLNDFTDSKTRISLVMSLAGVTYCLAPPFVGFLSDRTRIRFGRRRPYVLCGVLGAVVCLMILPHTSTFGIIAVVSAVMYLSMACAETPLGSLLADLTPAEQTSTASGVVHFLGSIGLIVFFGLGWKLWDEHPLAVFRTVAFVCLGCTAVMVVFIKEPSVIAVATPEWTGPWKYLRAISKQRPALTFFVAEFFWWLGFSIISSFITLFVVEDLKADEGDSLLAPMALTVMATIFVLPLGILGDRMDRKRLLSYMVAGLAVTGLLLGLSQNLTHSIIMTGLSGIPYAGVVSVAYAYALDLIPKERTAEFLGMHIISISASLIFGPRIGGMLIDSFGYRSIFPAAAVFTFIGLIILQTVRLPAGEFNGDKVAP